jgi:patatin-related protein
MQEPDQIRSRETRLGIVLYGGVSLAVYENGVAQELFRAVKGLGVYALIKELTDSDIIVDILSGTSAGGINGILLGFALANNLDFRQAATLWRRDGDIMQLLRNPNDTAASSLLDSTGYYQSKLEDAFTYMPPYQADPAGIADPSDVCELDLFVTSTNVNGRVFTEFDDQAHPIDVKDHRSVFKLAYRAGRPKNDFDPTGDPMVHIRALAKLARATSCFPVAFQPVHVQVKADLDPADSLLVRWGKLTDDAWFLDGGVLDNKPFSYTIDTIFGRTADRDIDRILFYVEPDPERFARKSPEQAGREPDVIEAATDALVAIPGYQSIARDLQSIALRNDKIRQYQQVRKCIDELPPVGDCLQQTLAESLALIGEADAQRLCIYRRSRLGQLRDRAVEGILKQDGKLQLLRGADRHSAKVLVESFELWPGDEIDTLAQFDVYYRMRRLHHVAYSIRDLLGAQPQKQSDGPAYRDLWRRINHQLQLLDIIRFAMESTMDAAPIAWRTLADSQPSGSIAQFRWQCVQNVLKTLLDTANIDLPQEGVQDWTGIPERLRDSAERASRERFAEVLKARMARLRTDSGEAARGVSGNLLAACDDLDRRIFERYSPRGEQDPMRQEYCRFIVIDSYLFPIEIMADLESKDQIRTVRISPVDAQRGFSEKSLQDKLCGNEVGHFGGFLKRSWRSNDIMWGRLDGVCQLIECFANPKRLSQVPAANIVAASRMRLKSMFPNATAQQIVALQKQLQSVQAWAAGYDTNPEDRGNFESFLNNLVRMAQGEILEEEIPRVLQDAIDQQVDWNEYKVDLKAIAPYETDPGVWTVGVKQIDRALTGFASEELARRKQRGQWTKFFEAGHYTVGSEKFPNDLPLTVLLEIVSTAVLVLKNALINSAPPKLAARIRTNLAYKFFLDFPLRALYAFTKFERVAPEFSLIAIWVLATVCAVLIVVGAVWWTALIDPNVHRWRNAVCFFFGPIIVLIALGIYLIKRRD